MSTDFLKQWPSLKISPLGRPTWGTMCLEPVSGSWGSIEMGLWGVINTYLLLSNPLLFMYSYPVEDSYVNRFVISVSLITAARSSLSIVISYHHSYQFSCFSVWCVFHGFLIWLLLITSWVINSSSILRCLSEFWLIDVVQSLLCCRTYSLKVKRFLDNRRPEQWIGKGQCSWFGYSYWSDSWKRNATHLLILLLEF